MSQSQDHGLDEYLRVFLTMAAIFVVLQYGVFPRIDTSSFVSLVSGSLIAFGLGMLVLLVFDFLRARVV